MELTQDPDHIYAIGDVHGCIDQLRELELKIVDDARNRDGSKLIVCLGDYIDRGPDSAAVIAHLLAPPPDGFYRICLCGNHEAVLVELLDDPKQFGDWLRLGGDRTLLSYGYDVEYMMTEKGDMPASAFEALPPEHLTFLRQLPVSFATPSYFFSHAGARPGVDLPLQSEEDLLWIREAFLSAADPVFDRRIVHGHTPVDEPAVLPWRIGIDTGAYMGRPLTTVHLSKQGIRFIQAN